MRVVIVHTYYQKPGGEDQSVSSEAGTLRNHGHEVLLFTLHNRALADMFPTRQAALTLWNDQVYRSLRAMIRRFKPDVVHIHNTFPLASPAAIHAAWIEQVPVVVTLRNYRLLCPVALFYRDGQVCEACLGKAVPWPGVLHGCWRGRLPSAVVAAMLS
ncbi:glycosyltransferase, partial [uncultured Chloroflexus sp.]|uniref:glycosyltransferase n=1 Tax=uncultured Chloroflexus sp. TaxID=214040 RepID=UPI00261C085B